MHIGSRSLFLPRIAIDRVLAVCSGRAQRTAGHSPSPCSRPAPSRSPHCLRAIYCNITFAEGSWQYVLEGRSVQQVTDLLLAQGLLHQQTEQDGVAQLPEIVEQLSLGIRVLYDVVELCVVVTQHSCTIQSSF